MHLSLLPLTLSLAPSALAGGQHPAGAPLSNAAVVDITPAGFDAVVDVLPALIPSGIEIPTMGDEYAGVLDQCWIGGYAYELAGAYVDIGIANATLVPQSGYLALDADLLISLNHPSDPMSLYYELECLGDTCDGYVDPFVANLRTTIALQIVESGGVRSLDAQIGTIEVGYDLAGEDIHLDNCTIGTVEEILNFFGISLYDLLLGVVGDQLSSAVADFGPEIEALIEESFASASISQDLDLNGVTAHLELYPSSVQIEPVGVRLGMDGSMNASEAAACIADYDPGGSLATNTAPPPIGSAPGGVDPNYHAGLNLSDDFGNQALYALWRGGLLCYTLAPGDDTLPISLDTSLLGLLAGDAFDGLFPPGDSKPMLIQTRPRVSPTLVFDGSHDVGVHVEQLGLEFYGELDHRQAQIVGVDLEADAGVDLTLNDATGELAIGVALTGEDITATVATNEFVPDADAAIEAGFTGLFETLVTPLLGGLVGDLAFALPSIEGLGLTSLEVAPAGDEGDWLGAYAGLGAVSYTSAGCDEGGGCDMGCASGSRAPGSGWLLLGLPLSLAALRRRRDG